MKMKFKYIISVVNVVMAKLYALKKWHYKNIFGIKNLDIYFPVFIHQKENVRIGENCAINAFVHIWANDEVFLGENTMIASHVVITTSTHDYMASPMRSIRIDKKVKIGANVWIGSGAVIMPGVTIGDGAVVGAGAVVLRDVPEGAIVAGVPARIIKFKLDVEAVQGERNGT